MSMAFFGWINPYRNEDSVIAGDKVISSRIDEGTQPERGSLLSDMLSFQRHRNQRVLRPLAVLTLLTTAWLLFPRTVFAKPRVYKAYSQLTDKGLTQTPDAKLRKKIEAREHSEQAKKQRDVEPLSLTEMTQIHGRGQYRNKYFAGAPMPWHRSFHDVNVNTGNLFKSFTDVQVAPGRGAGLVLQRTYNSNEERVGAFGIGWTHAYDIRIEEDGVVVEGNVEKELVPRTDFFGGKHKYTRDADGLYTPPAYLYDEMDSRYDEEMVSGLPRSEEDTQVGMDGTVKHFVPEGTDAAGKLSKTRVCDYIQDRFGNRTTLTYGQTITFADGSTKKLLTQVKDPVNRTLTFTWLNFGTSQAPAYRITAVQSPTYTVTYEYHQNAGDTGSYLNLWKVHLDSTGLNRTTTYTYTSVEGENGLLTSITDPLGHSVSYLFTRFTKDGLGWNGGYSGFDGPGWENPYVMCRQVTEPASGGTVVWGVSVRLGYGRNFYYRGNGSPYYNQATVVTDNQLRTLQHHTSDPYGGYLGIDYQVEYDINNNVISTQKAVGGYAGHPNIAFPLFTINRAIYGPHGNVLTQSTDKYPESTTTTTYYNASKYFQKASVTDALGRTSTFDYFDSSDPTPGNRGNVKWVRDAGYGVSTSPSYNKQFSYTYNQYGQKVSETNLNNVVTNYTYGDAWGNLTQVVQDPGTGKLNRTTSMAYDTVGKVTSSTDPNGQTSTFAYNTLGQPISASFPAKTGISAAETISYTYGANGRAETVTDGRGTTSMAYETGNDRVASVTDPVTGTTSYTYMDSGERATMTLPGGGTVTYAYNPTGNESHVLPKDDPNSIGRILTGITDDQGRSVAINLHHDGSTKGVKYNRVFNSGGSEIAYMLDENLYEERNSAGGTYIPGSNSGDGYTRGTLALRRTTYNAYVNGAWQSRVINQNNYTYNASSQRTSNTISSQAVAGGAFTSRTESYTYDELSRLKTANYGDGQNQTYAFDAMGNRLAKTDNITGNETYGYDNANRMLHRYALQFNYTNDANGNQVANGDGSTNDWDSQNRLVHSWNSGPDNEGTYVYGADGLRRKSSTIMGDDYNGNPNPTPRITHYGYDGSNVVREWEENVAGVLSVSATYLLGPSGPMYKRPATATDVRWYVYDGLGSVVGEVDVNGLLIAEKKHDVFGLRRGTVGTEKSKHGFVGGLGHYSDDETGLVYMRARYYDPAIGRFISEDPIGDGNNWFVYCNNNPINLVDGSGHAPDDYWQFTITGVIQIARTIALAYENGDISAASFAASITGLMARLETLARIGAIRGAMLIGKGIEVTEEGLIAGSEGAALSAQLGRTLQALGTKQLAWGAAAKIAARQIELFLMYV